jgi:hypothetical protein
VNNWLVTEFARIWIFEIITEHEEVLEIDFRKIQDVDN